MAKKATQLEQIGDGFDDVMRGIVSDNKNIEPEMHKAILGSKDKPMRIGSAEIPCYILDDETRVITGRGIQQAIGFSKRTGGQVLSSLLRRKELRDLSKKLFFQEDLLEERIEFTITEGNNLEVKAYGYKSDTLIDIANLIIQADSNGLLKTDKQKSLANVCRVITTSLSKTALIELIDSVTGYRDIRRETIEQILDMYLKKEFATWAKRFPDEFYMLICKLKGWPYDPKSFKRPGVVGRYTNNIVYSRIAPGLLKELQKLNPKNDRGNRKAKHHQWLTDDIGHPKLQEHIYAVLGLMRAASNWNQFNRMLEKAFPIKKENLLFDIYQYDEHGNKDL
ncbi:MAG: P63C domain-containing protein [Spirochaetales bacterium]|nr:P63C domain-containing protein [Spirochaetales bacterium]